MSWISRVFVRSWSRSNLDYRLPRISSLVDYLLPCCAAFGFDAHTKILMLFHHSPKTKTNLTKSLASNDGQSQRVRQSLGTRKPLAGHRCERQLANSLAAWAAPYAFLDCRKHRKRKDRLDNGLSRPGDLPHRCASHRRRLQS